MYSTNKLTAAAATQALEASKKPEPTKTATTNSEGQSSTPSSPSSPSSSASACQLCMAWPEPSGSVSVILPRRRHTQASHYNALFQRADLERGELCGKPVRVPKYTSWSPGATRYSPTFNYQRTTKCGAFNSKLDISIQPLLPGFKQGVPEYATEHIYEVQQIKLFLNWAAQNITELTPYYQTNFVPTEQGSEFCNKIFLKLFFAKTQWTASSFYQSRKVAPIQDIYNALEGSSDSTDPASEFVYLNKDLNSLKGSLFGLKISGIFNDIVDNLDRLALYIALSEYLSNDDVSNIYHAVSTRVEERFVTFGEACKQANAKGFRALAGIDWASYYRQWERDKPEACCPISAGM
jgi:hypothetical protein